MKKTYIIPVAAVVEIKTNQLLMASTMPVNSTDELNSGEILSREYGFGFDD